MTLVCLIGMGLCMFDLTIADGFPGSSLLGPSVLFGTEWNSSITKSQRSRAGIPSLRKPTSREINAASVELCETEVCFSHIQFIGTNVWLPKMHRILPDIDFESSRSPTKSESCNNPSLHCCAVFPTWQYWRYSLVWWIYEIKRAKRLSQAFVHFVTARASLFHKISGLPIRDKYRQFRTFFEQTVDNSPTDSFSFSLNWWSSVHSVATLDKFVESFYFASSQYLSTHFFAWPSMSLDQEDIVSASGFRKALVRSFSLARAQILDSNIFISV